MTPGNIRFEIAEEGGLYKVYHTATDSAGKTRRICGGAFEQRFLAEQAIKMCTKNLENNTKPLQKYVVRVPKRTQLQQMNMALDPGRFNEFFTQFIFMNMGLHMITDAFDRLSGIFDTFLDISTKKHYEIAQRHIGKMLDALLASGFAGDNTEDYCTVAGQALDWKDRFELLMANVKQEPDDFRWVKFNEFMNNIFTDAAIEQMHMDRYKKMRGSMISDEARIEE